MGAILRGFFAVKALLFGLVILVLWVRSYFVADIFHKGSEHQYVRIGSASGSVVATFGHNGQKSDLKGSWERLKGEEPAEVLKGGNFEDSPASKMGFGYSKMVIGDPARAVVVNVMLPHWLAFLLAIPSAIRWVWRWSQKPAAYKSGGRSWCPRCVSEISQIVEKCPRCGGMVASEENLSF